ncbi:uncharacterized protein B0H18DRAFT_1123170 [Fomitopsis serialis]|uniref:uncharacterized protein n=1 Tax=Fomitopsis serialis TaxID=139415 RepID=UPI002008EB15|nr:uncharacterized protein B0H18DRAFT_1123170 [Neoantrodia serialis]KAH9918129.1 hypothetical protein B0H18DRAFT_1123170 [Neoantrodia serialis]
MFARSLHRVALSRIAAARTLHLSAGSAHFPRLASHPRRDWRRAEFSTTPRRDAAEDESVNAMMETQQKFERIFREKPELKQHMKELYEVLKDEGIDFNGGRPPNKMQMLGLVFKPKVRDALMKVSASFHEMGINPQDIQEDLMRIAKHWNPDSK